MREGEGANARGRAAGRALGGNPRRFEAGAPRLASCRVSLAFGAQSPDDATAVRVAERAAA
jgi:hypothetical protein